MIIKHFLPSLWFLPVPSACHACHHGCVSLFYAFCLFSQSLWWGADARVTRGSLLASHMTHAFVVCLCVGVVHFTGPQRSRFCPLLVFHKGLLEPARHGCIYLTCLLMTRKTHDHEFPWFMIGPWLPLPSHLAENPLLQLHEQADILRGCMNE